MNQTSASTSQQHALAWAQLQDLAEQKTTQLQRTQTTRLLQRSLRLVYFILIILDNNVITILVTSKKKTNKTAKPIQIKAASIIVK